MTGRAQRYPETDDDESAATLRRLDAERAAHASWANTRDRTARTAPARRAFDLRFEDQVDPDRTLTPEERARRAMSARKSFYAGLAARSVRARRKAREALAEAEAAEAELAQADDGAE